MAERLARWGTVRVVAPEREQSAVGHAITVRDPVRAHSVTFEVESGRLEAWAVTGTPADCVKLARSQLLDRKPDLVVSGLNQGPNTAVNVIYSGTVSAATEAAILGMDAVACSLCDWEASSFEAGARVADRICRRVVERGLSPGILLNVNVPYRPNEPPGEVRVTRQAEARWEESFHARVDPLDRPYYWMGGEFVRLDERPDTDLAAIEEGYVSVTPLHFDLTAHGELDALREWDWTNDA